MTEHDQLQGEDHGPDTHANTDHTVQFAHCDCAYHYTERYAEHLAQPQPQPDADAALDVPEPHAQPVAKSQPHAHAHPAADREPAVVPAEFEHERAADRKSAQLSREQYAALGNAALGVRDALHVLGHALLDAAVAARRLAAVIGTLPDVRDGASPDVDPGEPGPVQPAGGDGSTDHA